LKCLKRKKEVEVINSIKIAGKEYELFLGFDFIRELDKRYPKDPDGFAMGVGAVYVDLQRLSPIGILNFIQAATNTLKSKPAVVDIEKEFESWDVEEVCRSFLLLLENSSMTKGQLALFAKLGQELVAMRNQG